MRSGAELEMSALYLLTTTGYSHNCAMARKPLLGALHGAPKRYVYVGFSLLIIVTNRLNLSLISRRLARRRNILGALQGAQKN